MAASHENQQVGVSSNEELAANRDRVDVRTFGEKFQHWMTEGEGAPVMLLVCLGVMFIYPTLMHVMFVGGLLLFFWFRKQRFHLPFRMPKSDGGVDYNDPKPGGKGQFANADGIVFLGNELGNNKELWVNASDAGTHFLVFGTTGAGKAIMDSCMVHTPSGRVRADRLHTGDRVYTPDGREAPVLGIFPQGRQALYRVTFDDGRFLDVSGDHQWVLHPWLSVTPLHRREATRGEVVTTLDILDRLRGDPPEGYNGIAIALPEAPDGPGATWGHQLRQRATHVALGLLGLAALPERADAGNREQRRAVWASVVEQLRARGRVQCFGRGKVFSGIGEAPAAHLILLARSLGHFAKREPGDTVFVLEDEGLLRISSVKPTGRKAACRCIKIDDPRGLFLVDDYIVTHNTEMLVSLAYNALVQGSGFIYTDGKGDNSLFQRLFSMARASLREDDLLVINYMTGGREAVGPQENKLSNTLNPFSSGTTGALVQLLVSLMPNADAGGDGGMWQGRAVAFLSALMMALCWLRDQGQMQLGVAEIREHLTLAEVTKLWRRTDMPERIKTSLYAYLTSLAGWVENPPNNQQSESAMEQHGYLQMQFTRVMGSLADDYGYIFNTTRGEVDFRDVVLNNRILAVLLPSLEKSPEDLGNLGKIIVASIRAMMATGLGDRLEGSVAEIIKAKPTNAPSPFLCILDEYGYYVVKGAAVMPAQARSLNFSMVFAGQDLPSFKKNNNAEEAAATVGNCNVVIFMKLMDMTDTMDLFKKLSGEAYVAKSGGYTRQAGKSYAMGDNAQIQKIERGSAEDLRAQLAGEGHVIFKRSMVRARLFHANPGEPKAMRLNHFLRVEPPSPHDIVERDEAIKQYKERLFNTRAMDEYASEQSLPPLLRAVVSGIEAQVKAGKDSVVCGISGIVAGMRMNYAMPDEVAAAARVLAARDPEDDDCVTVWGEDDEEDDGIDAMALGGEAGAAAGGGHGLSRPRVEADVARAEIAAGVDPVEAMQRSRAVVEAMTAATRYPNKENVPEGMSEAGFDDLLVTLERDLDGNNDSGQPSTWHDDD